jgi:hypothetical protein
LLVQRETHRRAQQFTRLAVTQAHHRKNGQGRELIARLAGREYEADGFGQQATGDEREGLHRTLIQPLRVVDNTEDRTRLSRLRQHAQHGQADEEQTRSVTGTPPEHDLQRLALWARQRLKPVEQRPA